MTKQTSKLIVVPGRWDNLPEVLNRLDYEYKLAEDGIESVAELNKLMHCRVLFVACGADCTISDEGADNLRTFVARGGAIYASDLAFDLVESLFPGKVTFTAEGYDDKIRVEVLDPGLAEIVGKSFRLHHDTEVTGIDAVDQGVRVLLQGPREGGSQDVYPYLIAFNHGEGQVIYTVFHNSTQTSETEKKLLDYLIFRPILSAAAGRAAAVAAAQMAMPGKEIFAAINPGETSARYGINASGSQTLLFVLSWEGSATLGLQVCDPAGRMVKDLPGAASPLVVEVSSAAAGMWTAAVTGLRVPQRNFPYVLTIATRSVTSGAAPRPVLAAPAATAMPAAAVAQLPLYLLVDGAPKVSDIAPELEAGVRRLAERLRARPARGSRTALGLFLADTRGRAAVPLTDVARFIAPSLRGQGSCGLGAALALLLDKLATRSAGPKPLVAVFLAGPPADDWAGPADRLCALASQGKTNVFVFGIGGYADGSVLGRLTPLPPLALSAVTQANVEQLFDWLFAIADVMLSYPSRVRHAPRQGTPNCHAERVNGSSSVAAINKRSISSWKFLGRPQMPRGGTCLIRNLTQLVE